MAFHNFRMYYSKFCNQEHFIKEEFERASNTELEFPKTFIGGSMTVKGNSINDVINARNDLHSIASSIRDKNRALQFISIPTLSPEISENFKQFKVYITHKVRFQNKILIYM